MINRILQCGGKTRTILRRFASKTKEAYTIPPPPPAKPTYNNARMIVCSVGITTLLYVLSWPENSYGMLGDDDSSAKNRDSSANK